LLAALDGTYWSPASISKVASALGGLTVTEVVDRAEFKAGYPDLQQWFDRHAATSWALFGVAVIVGAACLAVVGLPLAKWLLG
jgi:hypothetical protein